MVLFNRTPLKFCYVYLLNKLPFRGTFIYNRNVWLPYNFFIFFLDKKICMNHLFMKASCIIVGGLSPNCTLLQYDKYHWRSRTCLPSRNIYFIGVHTASAFFPLAHFETCLNRSSFGLNVRIEKVEVVDMNEV